ncbi:hypothetical protein ACFQUU_08605 [Herbaspirillum sp. GCM10030257]|uniref:hypothetical protein n=1 Tax=Herbaspirillum sp. GCM10030257 TaxID=3273393 RepID=UPI00360A9EA5
MNNWHSVDFTCDDDPFPITSRLTEAWLEIRQYSPRPNDLGIFVRYNPFAKTITAYFPPGAEEIAEEFNAKPCEKPLTDDLGLLVGHPDIWKIHFFDMDLGATTH